MKNILLVIDPQNDFCHENGTLFVPNADRHMSRLAHFVNCRGYQLDEIHVTMDSHHRMDIAHPDFWMDPGGRNPAPFTQIRGSDLAAGQWRARIPAWRNRVSEYVAALEQEGRYPLTIWPPHCLIGTWGHGIHEALAQALWAWETRHFSKIKFHSKGQNPWTEHYSAIEAEVPDEQDPTTQSNQEILKLFREDVHVLVAGEALSHCVGATLKDIERQLGSRVLKKITLLGDCTGPVSGFEREAEHMLHSLQEQGLRLADTLASPGSTQAVFATHPLESEALANA